MKGDSTIGPYRILRLINRGGQGSVFLGYDKRLQRRVAIKIYKFDSEDRSRNSPQREAQLLASIHSDTVVQIYDVIESRKRLALIMEYVPGLSLESLLAAVCPSLASVLAVGVDIAGALTLTQQQCIVHGDVKAANVLITEFGRAKLADFGIASIIGEQPSRQWEAGSFDSLSPEQYLGHPLDGRADLFALGCLLCRMLSGEQPFFQGGRPDVNSLLTQAARPLKDLVGGNMELPDQLMGLIDGLLEKNPANRANHADEVRQILQFLWLESRSYFSSKSPVTVISSTPKGEAWRGQLASQHFGTRVTEFWNRDTMPR
ncbi:MAG: serine/threonine-protein kinase [Halioglobus sp.]|nr:serine/threonine-protein kinase [Halioglobus sp.]